MFGTLILGDAKLFLSSIYYPRIFDFVYTLASANINQSAPYLVTIYITLRPRMSSIMGIIGPEHLKFFALELGKIAEFVYTLASKTIYTLASININ